MSDDRAFPQFVGYSTDTGDIRLIPMSGLSKRELFAAMAMQSIAVNWDDKGMFPELARRSVIMADALIDELSKTKETEDGT